MVIASDARQPPKRTAVNRRSALAPAARDRRDVHPTVHPKREFAKNGKKVHQEQKKLTSKSLKTTPEGIKRAPTKSRTVRKNERVINTAKPPPLESMIPPQKKRPSNRRGSQTLLQKQKKDRKAEQEDRNLPVKLHKEEGVPPMGIPPSAKRSSQLLERKP